MTSIIHVIYSFVVNKINVLSLCLHLNLLGDLLEENNNGQSSDEFSWEYCNAQMSDPDVIRLCEFY